MVQNKNSSFFVTRSRINIKVGVFDIPSQGLKINFTFLGNTTAIQTMFKRFAEVPIVTGLLCRGGGVDFHGAPRVDLTRRDGGNDTPGVSSLRCTSSASSCGWHRVDLGIHYPPATDFAGGRSPNVEGDHCSVVAEIVVTQIH